MWNPMSRCYFFFPEFEFVQEVNDFFKPKDKAKVLSTPQFLYLDWGTQRDLLQAKKGFFVKDVPEGEEGCPYGDEVRFVPPAYQEFVERGAVYAVPPAFRGEIERNVFRFFEERTMDRLTRNNMILLPRLWEPGNEHLWVSFYLAADCAFDLGNGGYMRGALKTLLPYLLAYRFWCGQIAGDTALLLDYARIYRLEHYYEKVYRKNDEFREDIEKGINAFHEHAKYWEEWVGSKREERAALQAQLRFREYKKRKQGEE